MHAHTHTHTADLRQIPNHMWHQRTQTLVSFMDVWPVRTTSTLIPHTRVKDTVPWDFCKHASQRLLLHCQQCSFYKRKLFKPSKIEAWLLEQLCHEQLIKKPPTRSVYPLCIKPPSHHRVSNLPATTVYQTSQPPYQTSQPPLCIKPPSHHCVSNLPATISNLPATTVYQNIVNCLNTSRM